jgi:nucleoside-diphosphate kinase
MAERTLIIVKPDGVQRHLIGEILGRFEKKGLKLIAAKFLKLDEPMAAKLYSVHKGKSFYEKNVKFLSSSPVLATVWEGQGVIEITRRMFGTTFGFDSAPGTIRGDLGCSTHFNLVHGSDSAQSADYEIPLFFKPEEIVNYEFSDELWLYSKKD